jgi:hypothetical protein
MTQFKTADGFKILLDCKKDLKKALAKAKGVTSICYVKRFPFAKKVGPLVVVGPIDKKLLAVLKGEHSGKEARCTRDKNGGFEVLGKVTLEEFNKALEFVGLDPAEIEPEDGTEAMDAINDKRVERTMKSFESDDQDQSTGKEIARLFETEEDVQEQVAAETALFAGFDMSHDSFETAQQSLAPAERRALDDAMTNMIRRAEKRHEELFGGTRELSHRDFDELIKIFSHIPRGLVPSRFKKELQDWIVARDAMRDMAVAELMKEAEPEVAEGIRNVIEAITSPAGCVTGIGGLIGGEKFEAVKTVIENASGALDVISNTIGALQAGGESMSTEERTALEQRMASQETTDALKELADTALDLGGDFIPIIGTINNAKNVVLSGATTLSRINKAVDDGFLRDSAALEGAGHLARALGQSCSREKRLAAEAGIKTVTSALGVASDVTVAADAGTLKIVNGVLKVGSKVAFNVADAISDTNAANVLKRARAGDLAAQEEIFNRHAHYAKFLLAHAAKKGDSLARRFFIDRDLTENDIEANSAEILMKFGLQQSKETAAPESTPDKLRASLEKAAGAVGKVGTSVMTGIKAAWSWITGSSGAEPVAPPADGDMEKLFTVAALKSMANTLTRAREQKAALGRTPAPAWLDSNLANLEVGLKKSGVVLRSYLAKLTDELSDTAAVTDGSQNAKLAAIRAQIAPLNEALRYLANSGCM